jgi:endoglucanase
MSYVFPRRTCLAGIALFAFALACARDPTPNAIEDPTPPDLPPPPERTPVALHGQLQVVGTTLVDQAGYPVQLKGVSPQWLNYATTPYAESRSALEFMRDHWKLSVIRAPMGTEAYQGYISNGPAMVKKVETIVQNAIRAGVYVLVDWHTEQAVAQQVEAVAFFSAMAQKYGGFPNVIWEPYNEPRGYTWEQIKLYHEAIVETIRAFDPDNLIVLGTPTWSQDVDTASLSPVAPPSGAQNLLYTLHFYSCTHKQWLRDKADVAIANGLPIFVTEFGATPADGGMAANGNNLVCRDETNLWFDWMAANNLSGVAWKLDQCAETSCILARSPSTGGPWPDDKLSNDLDGTVTSPGITQGGGHGLLVVDWIRQ